MDHGDAREELLQQYFDGELPPAQAAEVEAQLGRDPAYAARYESLTRLRELIALSAQEISADVDFNALYGRIEGDVREHRRTPTMLERLSVWWKELVEHRPAVAFGTPIAVAAGLAIAIWSAEGVAPRQERVRAPDALPPAAQQAPGEVARHAVPKKEPVAIAQGPAAQEPQNSEVVQVDFGENTGTVFEIALADGVSTPVVWINDEE